MFDRRGGKIRRPMSLIPLALLTLAGCGDIDKNLSSLSTATLINGIVQSGASPVAGASVQLYAATGAGKGAATKALLAAPVHSESDGSFTIPIPLACPSSSSPLYLMATGGNPDIAAEASNPAIAMMAVLGSCGQTRSLNQVKINELSTVEAVWPLAASVAESQTQMADDQQESTGIASLSRLVSDASKAGVTLIAEPAASQPSRKLDTLANILSPCVNSYGGVAGDTSSCGKLFSLAASETTAAPTDTLAAAIAIARHPQRNVGTLYDFASGSGAFEPTLAGAPSDWSIAGGRGASGVASEVEGPQSLEAAQMVSATKGTAGKAKQASATILGGSLPATTINLDSTQSGIITLSQPAPTAGLALQLSSSTSAVTVMPSLIKVAAGQNKVSFTYTGMASGTATLSVSATGTSTASVIVTVLPASTSAYAGPLTITQGGTYTGRWQSTNPSVPVITISTDQPVVIKNSILRGPGKLIWANHGGPQGIHLQVTNVLGIGVNPNISGTAKGDFLTVSGGTSIDVDHSTMVGVNGGVVLVTSNLTYLEVSNNQAINVDDRASNGVGGMLTTRPGYGHTVLLDDVTVPNGADISWNQFINQPGLSSVEDIISIYNSQGGSTSAPIHVHDNYLQGAVTSPGAGYTGGGIITDGAASSTEIVPAFALIEDNQVVETENYGLAIAAGHDVTISGNRVVSSGKTATGAWLEIPGYGSPVGYYLWNFYNGSTFFNNQIVNNYGGLVHPDVNSNPVRADLAVISPSVPQNDGASSNSFLLPLTSTAIPTLANEQSEYTLWLGKLQTAAQTVGAPASLQP